MKVWADLHTHTTASDGQYTPAQLVGLAKERGLTVVAITDHDTIAGVDEASFFPIPLCKNTSLARGCAADQGGSPFYFDHTNDHRHMGNTRKSCA